MTGGIIVALCTRVGKSLRTLSLFTNMGWGVSRMMYFLLQLETPILAKSIKFVSYLPNTQNSPGGAENAIKNWLGGMNILTNFRILLSSRHSLKFKL